jgi:hypothetical protein
MPAGLIVLDIDTNTINPFSGNIVTVNGVAIDSPTTDSIAVGTNALASVTTGLKNIGIGTDALSSVTFGNSSVAIGYEALKLYTGFASNVAIGAYALSDLVGNIQNTAIGTNSLQNTTSSNNTAVGFQSLLNNTTGSSNDAFGAAAGLLLNSGSFNTFLGTQAGSSLTSGNSNVLIGFSGANPGFLTSGDNNIIIGSLAFPSTPIVNNEITLGNSSNTVLRCAVTSITSLSDSRDKEEVAELAVGLEFVKELNPVSFVWNDRNESGKHGVKDFGFIAQDLKSTQEKYEMAETLGLVYEANPEKLEASYGKLIPILVQAIKELSAKVEALENK